MNNKQSNELDRMKQLMNYGMVNEETNTGMLSPRVEFSAVAADGKTYGIIKECNKFYIKVAPPKNTEVLAEDYDYIGGFMNKKANEYPTYTLASKQFDLKMMAINEACSAQTPVSQFKEEEPTDWQINETKEMRSEIDRFNQIMGNVQSILSEDKKGFTLNNKRVPEAPASHPSDKKVNTPFTDTAVANGDKEFTKKATNHKKMGAPFINSGEVTDSDMQSDKNPKKKTDAVYTEKAQFVPDNAVAAKKVKGGKAVKMNEGKRTFKLTEEQAVLAWNKNKDYMDRTQGTHVGSTEPYSDDVCCEGNCCETDDIHEGTAAHNTFNQNTPKPHVGEIGNTEPYDKHINEEEIDIDDVEGFDDDFDNDVPFPEVEHDYEEPEYEVEINDDNESDEDITIDIDDDTDDDDIDLDDEEIDNQRYNNVNKKGRRGMRGLENWEDDWNKFDYDDDYAFESHHRRGRKLSEDKLDDFGKHPAYYMQPMTTPPNKEVAPNGVRDWNDDSVKSDEPYGKKIGSSAPYDEEVIDMIMDAVISKIGFQEKA